MKNPKLTVRLGAEVSRIVIENGRAVGVAFSDKHGTHIARANAEIILAAGALVTPKILMLSGFGPSNHLAGHGIAVQANLIGAGQNLIDHPEVPITAYANGRFGYYKQGDGWRMLRNGVPFTLFGSGPITSAGVEAGAFVNPETPDAPPVIQAFCVPIVYVDRDAQDALKDGYGLTITTVVGKPKSRGEVRLASTDPKAMPVVSANLLKDPDDMAAMIAISGSFCTQWRPIPLRSGSKR